MKNDTSKHVYANDIYFTYFVCTVFLKNKKNCYKTTREDFINYK